MRSRIAPVVVLGGWCAALLVIAGGLLFAPAGLAGAPESDFLPASKLLQLATNSFVSAGLAALIALFVTLPAAIAATRLIRPRWSRFLLPIATAPLFIPPVVIAVAGVHLLGPQGWLTHRFLALFSSILPVAGIDPREPGALPSPIFSIAGVGLCEAWSFLPVAFLASWLALRQVSRALEESALLETTARGVLAAVTLPLARRGIVAGAILVFLLSLVEFGVPEALRSQPVLVAEVYTQFGVHYDTGAALSAAGVLALLAFFLPILCLRFIGPLPEPERLLDPTDNAGEIGQLRGSGMGTLRVVGLALLVAPTLALLATLYGTLAGPGGRLHVLAQTWKLTREEFLFTLQVAGISALVVTGTGLALGAALSTLRKPLLLRLLVVSGFFLPGPVVAVAFKMLLLWPPSTLPAFLGDLLARLDDSLLPLGLAYVIRFAPLVALLAEHRLRRVPHDLMDAARLESDRFLAAWRAWAGPALGPVALTGFLLSASLIMGESGATMILIPPGTTTLSVRILTLMHYAPTSQVSALCLLMALPALAAVGLVPILRPRRVESRATFA
jgi:iron(III) transport system permease protein